MRKARLDPTLLDRLYGLLPAGHGARILWARRAAATVLVLFAAVLAFRPPPTSRTTPVLVAAHDLAPGRLLTRADVTRRAMPSDLAPHGVLSEVAEAEGHVLSSGSRAGEPITDLHLASPALTRLTTGDPTYTAVPIRLTDPGIADLLYPGRRVDLVTADAGSGRAAVLAERTPVIAVRPAEDQRGKGRLVVVGLPQHQAAIVASLALTKAVTITLR
jgi:Flp pilus assembly protein CpaB